MRRPRFIAAQELGTPWWDDGGFGVVAGEGPDVVEVLEPREDDELHLFTVLSSQKIYAEEAVDGPELWEQLVQQPVLVRVCVMFGAGQVLDDDGVDRWVRQGSG